MDELKDQNAVANGIETGIGFAPFGGPAYEAFKRIKAVRAAAVGAIVKRDDPALLNAIAPALDDKIDVVKYVANIGESLLIWLFPSPLLTGYSRVS